MKPKLLKLQEKITNQMCGERHLTHLSHCQVDQWYGK